MKSCGLIVEYNPFHNGHKYHVQTARKLAQADVIIAVMSGNFLQRGEPAIIDKWHRAEEALANGVDLVIELPFCWSVQSADYFAKGAVQILQQIHCDALCFGTDSETTFDYQAFGDFVKNNQKLIDQTFQSLDQESLNYPQKMTEVFRRIYQANQLDFSSPNHILGMSYAKENARYEQPMSLLPLSRKAAGYHDQEMKTDTIASATAIRQNILRGNSVQNYIPAETNQDLAKNALVSWEKLWSFLRYRISSSTIKELGQIYQMNEGLEYRFKELINEAGNYPEFIEKMKTKRYTWTRLQRLSLYSLGNIRQSEISKAQEIENLRILGFTEKGRQFIKENRDLPWISRFSKKEEQPLGLTLKMDRIYQLADNRISEQNFGCQPIRL